MDKLFNVHYLDKYGFLSSNADNSEEVMVSHINPCSEEAVEKNEIYVEVDGPQWCS